MIFNAVVQVVIYLVLLLALIIPLGGYMAKVYENKSCFLDKKLKPIELRIYRFCKIIPVQTMDWKQYLSSMLIMNLLGLLLVYSIERLQWFLPFNPNHFAGVKPDLAFNTAVSYVTNTNWQAYAGEKTMSYFTQMTALTVQNFLSAATGMSLLIAFIRGLTRHETTDLGNFWVDMVRGILYILLPLSLIFAVVLASQGVIQNLKNPEKIETQPQHIVLPMGPVASQVAIKQLGTNGGGYFNANSSHPFENPTPLSNFLEMLALLLIPAAFCYTFGILVKDQRQAWVLLITMFIIFIPCMMTTVIAEQNGNPALTHLNIDQNPTVDTFPGGNMEGKETRFGIINSALFATATTASSNGSVNAMLDSFTPIGSLGPLWLIQLGEVIFGGVGSGLYGMLILVIITVFISGLMIGRTPDYLGKKIEPFEMKMASIAVLIMPLLTLLFTAIAVVTSAGISSIANPGTHGYTEILYAFSSMSNNNGSSFAGLNANTPFYNIVGGIAMLFGRYWVAIPTLAIAGSMAEKKRLAQTSGMLPTNTPLFVILLVSVTLILGALTFLPALGLGPIAEYTSHR